ncbi:hypothetical protein [uncultured Methylobacterium sp.]|jgi:hypothetical protein|uniref:hypothetical protein n=1 Tax=uncultured Methylobacterium sp. TaxID=157278 RepID=UPI00260ADE20|nr:hypothetical protein [uncultured Methylobacterium sp.]
MSVDLVGSTAFKSKHAERREKNEPFPIWLNRTIGFYRQFPHILNKHYVDYLSITENSENFRETSPKIWKVVGDEIIFCVRLNCLEHLSCCIRAFVKALSSYGSLLNKSEKELDVKGCAWIASFPAPNATIVSPSLLYSENSQDSAGTQLTEEDEIKADTNPREYDFLGKQIDTGFRISRFAQAHELALSIDLAWLLTRLKQRELVDFSFLYRGREALRGVIGSVPYPIITIQTERSVHRRELEALERAVTGAAFAEPFRLHAYLAKFMEINAIEVPLVKPYGDKIEAGELPQCYNDLKNAWNVTAEEEGKREKLFQDAGDFDDGGLQAAMPGPDAENLDEINITMEKIVKDYWSEESP